MAALGQTMAALSSGACGTGRHLNGTGRHLNGTGRHLNGRAACTAPLATRLLVTFIFMSKHVRADGCQLGLGGWGLAGCSRVHMVRGYLCVELCPGKGMAVTLWASLAKQRSLAKGQG
jgi:hypothetical protein